MKIGWQWTKLLQKLSGLLFWPTLYSTARTFKAENSQDRIYRTTSIKRRYQINSGLLIEATQSYWSTNTSRLQLPELHCKVYWLCY